MIYILQRISQLEIHRLIGDLESFQWTKNIFAALDHSWFCGDQDNCKTANLDIQSNWESSRALLFRYSSVLNADKLEETVLDTRPGRPKIWRPSYDGWQCMTWTFCPNWIFQTHLTSYSLLLMRLGTVSHKALYVKKEGVCKVECRALLPLYGWICWRRVLKQLEQIKSTQ